VSTAHLSRGCATPNPDSASERLLADALIATEALISPELYFEARNAGATHSEILAADVGGLYLADYTTARAGGLSHHQIVALDHLGWSPFIQTKVINEGITADELADVAGGKSVLIAYRECRKNGLSHSEALERSRPRTRQGSAYEFGADSFG
jgi:hypothetical protein